MALIASATCWLATGAAADAGSIPLIVLGLAGSVVFGFFVGSPAMGLTLLHRLRQRLFGEGRWAVVQPLQPFSMHIEVTTNSRRIAEVMAAESRYVRVMATEAARAYNNAGPDVVLARLRGVL